MRKSLENAIMVASALAASLGWSTIVLADRSLDSNYEKLLGIGIELEPEQRAAVILDYTRFVNFQALAGLEGNEFARKRLEDMEKKPLAEILAQNGATYHGYILAAGLGVYDFSTSRFPIQYYVSRDPVRLYRPCLESGMRRSCRKETPIGILPEYIYTYVDIKPLPQWVYADPADAELLVKNVNAGGDARRTLIMDVRFVATSLSKGRSKWSITFKPDVNSFSMRYGMLTAGPGNVLQWHP